MTFPHVSRFALLTALATVSFAALAAAAPLAITPAAHSKPEAQKLAEAKPRTEAKAKKAEPKNPEAKKAETKKAKPDAKKADGKKPDSRKSQAKAKPEPQKAAPPIARAEVPLPRPRPDDVAQAPRPAPKPAPRPLAATLGVLTPAYAATPPAAEAGGPFSVAAMGSAPAPTPLATVQGGPPSDDDVTTVKQAFEHIRRGKPEAADALQEQVRDRVGRKLIEWAILRDNDNGASFARYAAFVTANPDWPNTTFLRRRAEAMAWAERPDPAVVRGFFARTKPLTGKGRLALARALLAQGDRTAATYYVREAWRGDGISSDLERQVIDDFGELLNAADHRARLHARLYAEDGSAALRAAQRLGGNDLAIARAANAVNQNAKNAGALLEAVPFFARNDAAYVFHKIRWLRRNEKIAEAARVMLSAPRDPNQLHNLDEWWVERRLVARELLDEGDARTAYRVAAEAVTPPKEHFRAEAHFTAGWIALRFLDDPRTALSHFERIAQGTSNPITLARAFYWKGRAAEAAGHAQHARTHYAAAASYPTAYYGQIARAKLGMSELGLRGPDLTAAHRASLMQTEIMRAAQLLYAADANDQAISFMADIGDKTHDAGLIAMLSELATKQRDARAALLAAKPALSRGLPVDAHAFPTIGIPDFKILGTPVDKAVVYAISRQESAFNPRAVSSAKAMGLMQVLPGTAKMICRRLGIAFDQRRLLNDPVYNAQLGADELGTMIQNYRGSLILTFVGYNAGPGRVKQWIERYGDPRDPGVDPIDWVERIPFSETRNYVQRVLENVQVYRLRLGVSSKLLIEADLRRGAN
jgi:soluble lytic murein transglycosylase